MNFKQLYNYFVSQPEGQWIMKGDNAFALYNFINRHPIKRILDLGTGIGCSAAIMALALKEKGVEGHIDSLEQYDKCVALANKTIPEELKKYITIHKAEIELWQPKEIPYQAFINFKDVNWDYDFILNDGPAPFLENDHFIDFPNGTVHKAHMEDKIKPGTLIAWDGRFKSLTLLERFWSDNFLLVEPEENKEKFNVLERLNNPVQFRDLIKEDMIKMGYFKP